jgi:hypothetical protein
VFLVLADGVVVLHLAFVAFVVLGGVLVLRWPRLAWAHIPAAVWGAVVEFTGWICPLTPLEDALRTRVGQAPYSGDFVAHYLIPLLYPSDLTRTVQIILGTSVVLLNALVYWRVAHQHEKGIKALENRASHAPPSNAR